MKKRTIKKDQVIIHIGYKSFAVTSMTAATKIATGLKGAIEVDRLYRDEANDDTDYVVSEDAHDRNDISIEINKRVASRKHLLGLPAPK